MLIQMCRFDVQPDNDVAPLVESAALAWLDAEREGTAGGRVSRPQFWCYNVQLHFSISLRTVSRMDRASVAVAVKSLWAISEVPEDARGIRYKDGNLSDVEEIRINGGMKLRCER